MELSKTKIVKWWSVKQHQPEVTSADATRRRHGCQQLAGCAQPGAAPRPRARRVRKARARELDEHAHRSWRASRRHWKRGALWPVHGTHPLLPPVPASARAACVPHGRRWRNIVDVLPLRNRQERPACRACDGACRFLSFDPCHPWPSILRARLRQQVRFRDTKLRRIYKFVPTGHTLGCTAILTVRCNVTSHVCAAGGPAGRD